MANTELVYSRRKPPQSPFAATSGAESQGLFRDEEAKPKSKNRKKKFIWKVTGYTPCSKSCGVGKCPREEY